jgi:hypothetical protein
MQIRIPEEKPPLPHLAEVPVIRRFSWWPHRRRRSSLGELQRRPCRPRVSSLSARVGGRRRP